MTKGTIDRTKLLVSPANRGKALKALFDYAVTVHKHPITRQLYNDVLSLDEAEVLVSTNNSMGIIKHIPIKISFYGANMNNAMNVQGFDGTYGTNQAHTILEQMGLITVPPKPQPSVSLDAIHPLFLSIIKSAVVDYQSSLVIDAQRNAFVKYECVIDCSTVNIAMQVTDLLKNIGFAEVYVAHSNYGFLQNKSHQVIVQIPKTLEELLNIWKHLPNELVLPQQTI